MNAKSAVKVKMTGNAAGVWTPSYISIVRQTGLIPRKWELGAGMNGFEWVWRTVRRTLSQLLARSCDCPECQTNTFYLIGLFFRLATAFRKNFAISSLHLNTSPGN